MEPVLETLIHSPKLATYYRQLEELVTEEQQRRQQFYDSMNEQQKVEFINGETVIQSPVKLEHEFTSNNLNILLRVYVNHYDLGYVGHEKMLVTLTRNDYEPGICYWRREKSEKFTPDQTKFPAPDLVVEVLSPSTEVTDRTIKFEDYATHGVQEYWIIDPQQKIVEQYILKEDHYELQQKADSGILKSFAVAGFQIPAPAIFDQQEHLKALQKIVAR